jgi:hypothetical protein
MKYCAQLLFLLTLATGGSAGAQYLGDYSANQYAPNSTSNPYGAGSPYDPNSVNNRYGRYGSSSVFICAAHVPTIANSSDMIRSEDLGGFINGYRAKDPRVRTQLRSMTQLQSSQTEILLLAQTNGKVKESSKPAFRSGPTHIDNYFSQGTYSTTGTDVDQLSIPGSINTITGQQIQDRAATDLQKSLQYTPGLSVR